MNMLLNSVTTIFLVVSILVSTGSGRLSAASEAREYFCSYAPEMIATIEAVTVTPTTKETFKDRWDTFQTWYKDQQKEARAKLICRYSTLLELKLKYYQHPDKVSKELDALYQKASDFLTNATVILSPPGPPWSSTLVKNTNHHDTTMMATIEAIKTTPTTKETFKERWEIFLLWLNEQPVNFLDKPVCNFSTLVKLKLKYFKHPTKASKELDARFLKTYWFINSKR